MRLALVGASGLVGREMIKVIETHRLEIDEMVDMLMKLDYIQQELSEG